MIWCLLVALEWKMTRVCLDEIPARAQEQPVIEITDCRTYLYRTV